MVSSVAWLAVEQAQQCKGIGVYVAIPFIGGAEMSLHENLYVFTPK
jgi:hypothetical protein